MNTGYQQSTVAFCVSKSTNQSLDINGELCEETGRKQAVLLLEGYSNPAPDAYEVAGTFARGEQLDDIATRRFNTDACPLIVPPLEIPLYTKYPIQERYFVYNDYLDIPDGKHWLGGMDWDSASTSYRGGGGYNQFTAKVRRVGEHEWMLSNVPGHVISNDTNVKKYELTQSIVDAHFHGTLTMKQAEIQDGIHIASDETFAQKINIVTTENRNIVDPKYDSPNFNRFRSKDELLATVEINNDGKYELVPSSTRRGIGSNGNVYKGQRQFTISVNNTAEGRSLLKGITMYYNGTIYSDPDKIAEIGEIFDELKDVRTFQDSDIMEDGNRLRALLPSWSDWVTCRFFQLPEGVTFEDTIGENIQMVLERGDISNTIYAPNYTNYSFDTDNWQLAKLPDFMQLVGMAGTLNADEVMQSLFSSPDDAEFPYNGMNIGKDELGSRMTMSGCRDNGQNYAYLWHGSLAHFHAFPEDLMKWNGKSKLRFTTSDQVGGYKIAYEQDYFELPIGPYDSGAWKMGTLRFCRRLSDEELGYKLYIDEARDTIRVLPHTSSNPATPASVGLTASDELPKGALRGLAVRWMNQSKTQVIAPLSRLREEIDKARNDPQYGWFGFPD